MVWTWTALVRKQVRTQEWVVLQRVSFVQMHSTVISLFSDAYDRGLRNDNERH